MIWGGIGEMENVLKQYLVEEKVIDDVHFLGSRDDVPELMQISDLFLFPSLFEGLGIVLIEAQAADLPCLVSDTVPKMVDCGGCYFYSIKQPAVDWANQANQILDGEIKMEIQENLLNEYTIKNMVSQMETLF